jgi:pyruvate-formate lyase-activating enzyme
MSIREWFNSEPMQQARTSMFGDTSNSICHRCYHEELHSGSSRRHRSNQKSVIFTKTNFLESYNQSPGHDKFEHSRLTQGAYDGMPIDLHIDLGNYCNLSCKMCNPEASSQIAAQYVKWNIDGAEQYIGTDWTRNNLVWNRVLNELSEIPNLKNIHFMGGETLITKRFEDFVDFMIAKEKLDLNFSFVTNGTTFNEKLLSKLNKFDRVGIEISIETTTAHNQYQRQGTDTELVLSNIDRYLEYCDGNKITLTVRPAISLLTIGYYHTLLKYCLDQNLIVKGLIVHDPNYLDARILPDHVRALYKTHYQQLLENYKLESVDCSTDYNESDPNQLLKIVKSQILQCINLLDAPRPPDSDQLLSEMVHWCRRWDTVHGYNAVDLYPELKEVFVDNGY